MKTTKEKANRVVLLHVISNHLNHVDRLKELVQGWGAELWLNNQYRSGLKQLSKWKIKCNQFFKKKGNWLILLSDPYNKIWNSTSCIVLDCRREEMALRKAEMEATKVLVLQLLCEFQNYITQLYNLFQNCNVYFSWQL